MTSQHDLASIARTVIEVFSARSQALGSKPWAPGEVCAPAPLRLYRASVSELFVIDRDDQRVRAEIGE